RFLTSPLSLEACYLLSCPITSCAVRPTPSWPPVSSCLFSSCSLFEFTKTALSEISRTKNQIPIKLQTPNSKIKPPRSVWRLVLGNWILVLLCQGWQGTLPSASPPALPTSTTLFLAVF